MPPYITVITSTLNCEDEIIITAKSIDKIDSLVFQWIIADGGSTDKTLSLLSGYTDINIEIFSEPDSGIYDAWNKACRLIKGEWIIFLGAGDHFAPDLNIDYLVSTLQKLESSCVIAYGDVAIISNSIIRYVSRVPNLKGWEFSRPRLPNHQGVFQRKCLFQNIKPFDDSYRIAADSKFLLSSLQKGESFYINTIVSYMSDSGVSSNYINNFRVQKEINRLCKELNIRQGCIRLSVTYLLRCFNYLSNCLLPLGVRHLFRRLLDDVRTKSNANDYQRR